MRAMIVTGLLLCGGAMAQEPAFEVASVKPAAPMVGGGFRISMGGDPGRLNYSNVSLRDLIRAAFQLKDYQISGPDWLNNERFDVVAKLPDGAKESEKWAMLQTLLKERFKLEVHREKKDLPAYALTVAKGGPKMKESVPPAEDTAGGPSAGGLDGGPVRFTRGPDGTIKLPPGAKPGMMFMTGMGSLQTVGITLDRFAEMLTNQTDRPVVDETGLTAKYDITLRFTPEPGAGGPLMTVMKQKMEMAAAAGHEIKAQDPSEAAPPLPVALQQQLGLKLEGRKLPVDVVVVDHIEKVPVEN